ncbi:hypothetical protein ACWDRR_22195 [Kitasatospora sp. NPDC003701]
MSGKDSDALLSMLLAKTAARLAKGAASAAAAKLKAVKPGGSK